MTSVPNETSIASARPLLVLGVLSLEVLSGCGAATTERAPSFEAPASEERAPLPAITVARAALFPEGIEHDPTSGAFLVGSFREGAVYAVAPDGSVTARVEDDRLFSVLGLQVDLERHRLLVVNADLGVAVRRAPSGAGSVAGLGIYDLATGAPLHYVDLAALRPDARHLANAVAIDAEGNAYVTDSFSPIIYRVDLDGNATVFVEDPRLAGEGVNLNGIVYHPDGYLVVVNKRDGVLYRVPVTGPASLSAIALDDRMVGADGLVLASPTELVVIANRIPGTVTNAAYALRSDDGWHTASVTEQRPLGDVYPTTGATRDGVIYVVHTRLDTLIQSTPETREALDAHATIEAIGRTSPLRLEP
jgi:sugar lactone lactonase YvrE